MGVSAPSDGGVNRCRQWWFIAPHEGFAQAALSACPSWLSGRSTLDGTGTDRGRGFYSQVLALSHSATAEGPPAPFGSMKLNAVRQGRHHLCHLALMVPGDISAGTGFGQDNHGLSPPCCTKALCLTGAGWKRPAGRRGAACEAAALPTKGPGASPLGAHLHVSTVQHGMAWCVHAAQASHSRHGGHWAQGMVPCHRILWEHTGPSGSRLLPGVQAAGDLTAEQESLHDGAQFPSHSWAVRYESPRWGDGSWTTCMLSGSMCGASGAGAVGNSTRVLTGRGSLPLPTAEASPQRDGTCCIKLTAASPLPTAC